jgi:hypothetical protein
MFIHKGGNGVSCLLRTSMICAIDEIVLYLSNNGWRIVPVKLKELADFTLSTPVLAIFRRLQKFPSISHCYTSPWQPSLCLLTTPLFHLPRGIFPKYFPIDVSYKFIFIPQRYIFRSSSKNSRFLLTWKIKFVIFWGMSPCRIVECRTSFKMHCKAVFISMIKVRFCCTIKSMGNV